MTGDGRVAAAVVRSAVHALGEADRVELVDLTVFETSSTGPSPANTPTGKP